MIKKEYLVPNLEVIEIKFEGVIATSFTPGEETENNPNEMTNKRQNDFLKHTWE